MASSPPILALYIEAIHPSLTFIVIGVAWSASLTPLLIMLLYLSTPALRRQLIFLMNLFSVTVGIAFNFGLAVYNVSP